MGFLASGVFTTWSAENCFRLHIRAEGYRSALLSAAKTEMKMKGEKHAEYNTGNDAKQYGNRLVWFRILDPMEHQYHQKYNEQCGQEHEQVS